MIEPANPGQIRVVCFWLVILKNQSKRSQQESFKSRIRATHINIL